MVEAIFLFAWFIIAGHVQDNLRADIQAERIEKQEQQELYEHIQGLSMGKYGKPVHEVLEGVQHEGKR